METDAEVNAANSISILGFVQAVTDSRGAFTYVIAAPFVVLVIGFLVRRWADEAAEPALIVAALAVGALLISPHTMFYDAGLLALVPLSLATVAGRGVTPVHAPLSVAVMLWIGALVHPLARSADLPATPLAIVVAAGFGVLVRQLIRPPSAEVVAFDADDASLPVHGKAA